MTTLEGVYTCVTPEELAQIKEIKLREWIRTIKGMDTTRVMAYEGKIGHPWPCDIMHMREIPLEQFNDILHDRIMPWRLRELDFKMTSNYSMVNGEKQWMYWKGTLTISPDYASAGGGSPLYLDSFTDLLTLIRFTTPPTE